jgi:hypothetical protein
MQVRLLDDFLIIYGSFDTADSYGTQTEGCAFQVHPSCCTIC